MTDWKIVQGSKPKEIDDTSSAYTVYVRRNVKELTNEEGESTGLYEYEEKTYTKEEYEIYKSDIMKDIEIAKLKEEISSLKEEISDIRESIK